MSKTYWEKLKDPRWQKKRLEIMERDKFTCQHCRSKENTLNVDHRIYEKGKEPWEYENHKLVTLCEKCHKTIEAKRTAIKAFLATDYHVEGVYLMTLCDAAEEPMRCPGLFHSVGAYLQFLSAWKLCKDHLVEKNSDEFWKAHERLASSLGSLVANLGAAVTEIQQGGSNLDAGV